MSSMSLTKILLPAALALAIWGGAMAVSGFRQGKVSRRVISEGPAPLFPGNHT